MEMNGDADRPELLAETSFEVLLYIYDLSKELAKSFKKILKGKPLPGIWHTGLVAYGREYYFGSTGIESCRPGETILGEPDQILTLGKTELPYSVFLEYIFALGESTYRPGSYHLLEHNCNCFSQEVCQFITGGSIPEEIRELPQDISANKTLSNALKEYFNKLSLRAEGSRGISFGKSERVVAEEQRNGHDPAPKPQQNGTRRKKSSAGVNGHSKSKEQPQPTEQRPKEQSQSIEQPQQKPKEQPQPVEQQKPKDKSPPSEQQHPQQIIEEAQNSQEQAAASAPPSAPQQPQPQKQSQPEEPSNMSNGTGAAEPTEPQSLPQEASNGVETSNGAARVHLDDEEDGQTNFTPRRQRRYEDPPVLFPNVDGPELLRRIMELVEGKLTPEENKDLNEFMEYLTTDGGAWALGSSHLEAIGRLLNDRNLHPEIPVLTLKMFQAAALKEDIILLLHQDREKHHLMTYFYKIESLSHEEQAEVCALMCNMCSNGSSFDWLTYISEWEEDGKPCNNCRVTVRVAVHGLLAEHPDTQVRGCALVYNLALKKELFDDVASELAMAVLQFLQIPPAEELLFQSLTALYRFMCISYNEIPALMKMMGPDVEAFRGASARIEPVVEEIQMKLRVALSCENCASSVEKALSNIPDVKIISIDVEKQSVVVESSLPSQVVKEAIESTGKRAVLKGFGSKKLESAVAELKGEGGIFGVIRFHQVDKDLCVIDGTVDGLSSGEHGLHIHEYGDLSQGCESIGPHFNPTDSVHGGREDLKRHYGDLGNIVADSQARASFRIHDNIVKVYDIIGRSLAVTADRDDLGKGNNESSTIDGNSGKCLAAAIIARSAGLFENPKRICQCDGVTVWDETSQPKS